MHKKVVGLHYADFALGSETEIKLKAPATVHFPVVTFDNRLVIMFDSDAQLFRLGDMIEDYRASVSEPMAGEAA